MDSPAVIPNEWIVAEPANGPASALRKGTDGVWVADNQSAEEPAITIQLVEAESEPVLVGSIIVDGTASGVQVFSKPSVSDEEDFKPVSTDENGKPTVSETAISSNAALPFGWWHNYTGT